MAKTRGGSGGTGGLFRSEVPKMPDGYYSGDRPNPNLAAFVEAHLREKPYTPDTDDYDVPAFDQPIATTKATAIYNMHTYWSKKPHDAIRQYIAHYTEPGDLVLDPFCGSGGTALAALIEGRKAIAIDRSPAATFITRSYCTAVDVTGLRSAFEDLKASVQHEMDWLYETRCDRCGGKATTGYTVYSQVFQCPRCMAKVPLFDCVEADLTDAAGNTKTVNACPHCEARGQIEPISTRSQKFGAIPVLVSYNCQAGCTPKADERRHNDPVPEKRRYFEEYDLAKLREIEALSIPHWCPDVPMIRGRETCVKRNLAAQGVHTVSDLFTKRNLWALAAIRQAADALPPVARDAALLALTGTALPLSRMQRHSDDPRFPNRIMMGTYYIPQVGREFNAIDWYMGKLGTLLPGLEAITRSVQTTQVCVSTQSATELADIPTGSVDLIFTDPPYGANIQYGELNFVWEAWLRLDVSWHSEEIIVNEIRGKTDADWAEMMLLAMRECYRVLKPGRWLSLCYHDTSEGTWALVQEIMAEVGFVVDGSTAAVFIETGQKSFNQITADKVTKRDLVINFRKPKPAEIRSQLVLFGDEDETTFREKLHSIMRDFLSAFPGSTKDRVYDEVVSRMVRSGQMEAHDFDGLLSQVAEPVSGEGNGDRWYLREDEEAKADSAESQREDVAAAIVANFVNEWIASHPGEEGVHYSDIFEHFLYAVKDKPRRQLAEWLPDYFYKTELGTWRLPASPEEEKAKADGRRGGVSRRIKRYLGYLRQGLPVPEKHRPTDSTLAEWLRHCKLAGLYQEGKLLFETGGLNLESLSDEAAVEAEEDYEVCVRMLERQPAAKPKKGKAKKAETTLELDL